MEDRFKAGDFKKRIEAHHTLNHDVEAFLAQSTFIEGLLRDWVETLYKLLEHTPRDQRHSSINPMAIHLQKNIEKDLEQYPVSKLIALTEASEALDKDTAKKLRDYFRLRNIVVHRLIKEYGDLKSNGGLEDAYQKGDYLISNPRSRLNVIYKVLEEEN